MQRSDKKQVTTGAISDATINKIRDLVEAEDSRFSVSSPMDRLESFFIRTVLQAQEASETTSGAVSTTEIGAFLKDTPGKVLLDKLVSGETNKAKTAGAGSKREVVSRAKTAVPGPDEAILDSLVSRSADSETKAVEEKHKKGESLPIVDQIKESILEDLTRDDQSKEPQQRGDLSDA